MRRFVLATLIAATITTPALAGTTARFPSTGDDCSWQSNGEIIEVAGETYKCVCARLVGPSGPEVICRWWLAERLAPKPTRRVRHPLVRVVLIRPVIA